MTGSFDFSLVLLSYAISVFGSYTGLMLAGQVSTSGKINYGWLFCAAIALGGGAIWSMHFIGMLAYKAPVAVGYDLTLTILSMLVAIVFTGIGVFLVIRQSSMKFSTLVVAGVAMGLGVAAMHYTGMAAMKSQAAMHHDTEIVVISIVIAIVASIAALWIAFTIRKTWQKVASAFVMGVAVCGMHYTAMLGFSMSHLEKTAITPARFALPSSELAIYIAAAATTVLAFSLVAVIIKTLREVET